jgi:hypothetical protein
MGALATPEASAVVAYCTSGTPPAFAATPEPERLAALSALASEAGAPLPTTASLSRTPLLSDLADAAARRIVSDEALRVGVLGNEIVSQAWMVLCYESDVESWLPSLCAPLRSDEALLELRRRVVRDIAAIPTRMVERHATTMPPELLDSLRLASALLDTVSQSLELYHLAKRMAHDTVSDARGAVAAPCSANQLPTDLLRRSQNTRLAWAGPERAMLAQRVGSGLIPEPRPIDPLVVASRVLIRLLEDGPSLDRPAPYYVAVVENVLRRELQSPGLRLSPLQTAAAEALVSAIRSAGQVLERQAAQGTGPEGFVETARAFSPVIEHAASLAANRRIAPPPATVELVGALARGDLPAAMDFAETFATSSQQAATDSASAVSTLRKAIRIAGVRNQADARRVLIELVIPVGPWSGRYLFDLNGGVLKLEAGSWAFAGDGGFGYNGDDWGGYAQASLGRYRLVAPNVYADTRQGGGSMDAWMSLADDGVWRLEGRLSAGGHSYRTTRATTVPGSTEFFSSERSTVGRGLLMAGLRYQPDLQFALGLWVGAGAQYERYQPVDLPSDARTISLQDDRTANYLFSGRLRGQYRVIPGWLAVRWRGDVQVFRITREALSIEVGTTVEAASSVQRWTQWDASGRLFLDGDALALGGFVPSLHGGADAFVLRSEQGETVNAVSPVFGAGVRREVF